MAWLLCSNTLPLPSHTYVYIYTYMFTLAPSSPPPLPSPPSAPSEPNYHSTTHSFSQHARVSPRKGPTTNTSTDSTVLKEKVCMYLHVCGVDWSSVLSTYTYICTCIHTYTYVHMYLYVYILVCIVGIIMHIKYIVNYAHVYVYVCMYVGTVHMFIVSWNLVVFSVLLFN